MPDFLPRRSVDMLQWSRNFDQLLSTQYQSYGITQPLAELYSQLHADFLEAFRRDADPSTKGPSANLARRTTEAALRKYVRKVALQIRGQADVTDQQRRELGLRERRKKPTKPQLPWSPP